MLINYYQLEAESKLDSMPFNEGTLYFIVDTKRLFLDPVGGGSRISVNESPIILSTESERENLLSPIPGKLYVVLDSSSSYIYYNTTWYKCGSPIPECTTNDNNKFLMVINGEPAWKTYSHTHAASSVTTGTFAGTVKAGSSYQAPGTSLLRNSKLVSTESTPTVNGEIILVYE